MSDPDSSTPRASVDPGAQRERPPTGTVFAMGEDPMGSALILVPDEVAHADILFNNTLYKTTTMGQVRRVPGVIEVIEGWMGVDENGQAPWEECFGASREELPDDFTFNPMEPYNADGDFLNLILPADRTEELAPVEILDEFGTHDDYDGWPSPPYANVSVWLRSRDADAIERRMHELGYAVIREPELLKAYYPD